jgi:hypothetical protein
VGFVKLAKVSHVRDIEDVLREVKQGGSISAPPKKPLAAEPPSQPKREEKSSPPDSFTFVDIFTRRVEDKSAAAAVYLQNAERIARTESGVEIVMPGGTPLAMLQTKEHKTVLDAAASELVGKAVSVSLIMKEQRSSSGLAAESARDEPLVKRFLEVFRGDLAQVKPAKGE